MANQPPASVAFGEGRELRSRDFREALQAFHRQQPMMVTRGRTRQPHETDYLPMAVYKNGTQEKGWRIQEVHSNVGGEIGVTEVTIILPGVMSAVLSYTAHAEELSVLSPQLVQPRPL